MIAKLLVISLLAVEQLFAEEVTSAFQTISLPAATSSLNWTTPEASKNISSNVIVINAIPVSDVSPFRLQHQKPHSDDQSSSLPKSEKLQPQMRVELKDLGYYPVERDTSMKNDSHFHIRNESVESHQQIDRPRGKSKGYIEFEFDIDDEISTSASSNTTNSSDEEVVPYSSALNRIWSSLIPRSMTDIFKLSFAAGPQISKDKPTMLRSKPLESRSKSSVKRQSVDNRNYKLSPTLSISSPTLAATEKTSTNISGLVTRKDIHDINVAAEVIKTSKNLLGRTPIETSSLLGEKTGRNESDYEDYSLNLGEDNFIAPSQEVSKQLVYQTKLEHDEKHGKSAIPELERQINVQIIQDNLGGYGQKLSFSPSKQLDDIHDEVEKQFNPNDITRQSEAPSRKFLKKFKTNVIVRPPYANPGYVIVIKPKTIQPESLLHTYIHSSESLKGPVSNGYSTGNNSHVAAAPESTNQISEVVQAQTRTEQAHPEGLLHNYIFSSEFGKDSHPDPYNKSDSTATKDKVENFYKWNPRPSSENQGTGEMPPQRNNLIDVRGLPNEAEAHMYTTAPYHSGWPAMNSVSDGYSNENDTYLATPARNAYDSKGEAQSRPANPKSHLHTYIFPTELDGDEEPNRHNKSESTLIEDEIDYNYEGDAQTSENQENRKISLQHSNVPDSRPDNYVNVHSGAWHDPVTEVEIQKSVNIHNKYITEENGNLIEQHEIYTRPKVGMNFDRQQLEANTQTLLSEHPIRVAQSEELQQSESAVESESVQQHQHQPDLLPPRPGQFEKQVPGQTQIYRAQHEAEEERLLSHPASRENIAPQQYQVGLVERYIDRPVHVEHIFEKQVNVPYPVREVVEKIVDRPVQVEKIVDRPVHIPYAVQVDHFIDRPYAVQVPVAVPFPVHRYIDRPYPVEKIVDRPIHIRVPYPVETVVEKIIEKHVPVEVERIVEKPVEKQLTGPYTVKEIVNQPVPIPIPVPVGVPVAVSNTISGKRKPEAHAFASNVNDFLELVPPSLPAADGQGYGYKTLPENIDILLLDDLNFQLPNRWGQPVKRGTKSHYIKRSPEFGRHFRVEYGFKPPIVPSLEIDEKGLPLAS